MRKKSVIQILIVVAVLVGFLCLTDPNNIALPMVVVPYLLIGLLLYKLFILALHLVSRGRIGERKIKLYSIVFSVIAINFALLKSIGQLTVQDSIISVAIILIASLYISKFSFYS